MIWLNIVVFDSINNYECLRLTSEYLLEECLPPFKSPMIFFWKQAFVYYGTDYYCISTKNK